MIDVTPFEGVVGIIVRDLFFILGDDDANLFSIGGAIKQQIARVNELLQLLRCKVIREIYRPFRDLSVLMKDMTKGFS